MNKHIVDTPPVHPFEKKQKEKTREFGGLWWLWSIPIVLGVYFGSQIAAVSLLSPFVGGNYDKFVKLSEESVVFQFGFIALIEVLTLLMLWGFMKLGQVSWERIGLSRRPKWSDVGSAFVTFGVYFLLLAVIMALVQKFLPSIDMDQEQQIGFEGAHGPLQLGLVFVSLAILPPLVEEIMIRGFLYGGLSSRLPKVTSAIIASLIFGAAHLQLGEGAPPLWTAAIDTCFLSLVLIYLRERTGSLWAGIFVHSIKNSLAFLALFVFATH